MCPILFRSNFFVIFVPFKNEEWFWVLGFGKCLQILFIKTYICSMYSLKNLNKHIKKKHKHNQDNSYLKIVQKVIQNRADLMKQCSAVQIFMNQCSVDFVNQCSEDFSCKKTQIHTGFYKVTIQKQQTQKNKILK